MGADQEAGAEPVDRSGASMRTIWQVRSEAAMVPASTMLASTNRCERMTIDCSSACSLGRAPAARSANLSKTKRTSQRPSLATRSAAVKSRWSLSGPGGFGSLRFASSAIWMNSLVSKLAANSS